MQVKRAEIVAGIVIALALVVAIVLASASRLNSEEDAAGGLDLGNEAASATPGETVALVGTEEDGSKYALGWEGEMAVRIEECVLFPSQSSALKEYGDLSCVPSMEEDIGNGAMLVCAIRFENVNAKSFSTEDGAGVFSTSVIRLSGLDAQENTVDQAVKDGGSALYYSGTPKSADYKGFYDLELPQGSVDTVHFGFVLDEKDSVNSWALVIGAEGDSLPAAELPLKVELREDAQ